MLDGVVVTLNDLTRELADNTELYRDEQRRRRRSRSAHH